MTTIQILSIALALSCCVGIGLLIGYVIERAKHKCRCGFCDVTKNAHRGLWTFDSRR